MGPGWNVCRQWRRKMRKTSASSNRNRASPSTNAGKWRKQKAVDNCARLVVCKRPKITMKGGGILGSVIKKRRKKMRKHKHRKLLARTRHQRRKGK